MVSMFEMRFTIRVEIRVVDLAFGSLVLSVPPLIIQASLFFHYSHSTDRKTVEVKTERG